jgi:2-(1,2-epoxy-1,2-dihydrophenyl)acetyl-CoA isomerase
MMLGEKVPAADAEKMGMIYKAVPDEGWDMYVHSLAHKLAAMPTQGLALTKKALNMSLINDLKQQLDIEEELQTAAGKTSDYEEGVRAFLEKRTASFTGK